MRNTCRAFTLIELLVVIIIVAILASVAVPIMQGARKRAIVTEAVTALGMIRSAERLYFVEYGDYCFGSDVETYRKLGFKMRPDVERSDLDGLYFSQECYLWGGVGDGWAPKYKMMIECTASESNSDYAARAAEVKNWRSVSGSIWPAIWMDENGNIYSDIEGLGYSEP